MKMNRVLLSVLVACQMIPAAQRLTNAAGGYSVYVPDGWSYFVLSEGHGVMVDTTEAYEAFIGIAEHTADTTPAAWATITAYAYRHLIITSYPLYSHIAAFDNLEHDGLFGMYLNADYAEIDTAATSAGDSVFYSEHQRFVAVGSRGYQIYIQTDYTDMRQNYLRVYKPLVDSVAVLRENAATRMTLSVNRQPRYQATKCLAYDLLGRRAPRFIRDRSASGAQNLAGKVYVIRTGQSASRVEAHTRGE